jgi:MYXO-CTERM domain-containing protein
MRSFSIVSATLLATCLTSVASANPSGFVLDVPANLRVSTAQPVASARTTIMQSANVPSHVHLAFDRERVVGALRILRFRQEHRGVPVFGRGAAVAVDPHGVSQLASAQLEDRLPDSVTPAISPAAAAIAASKVSGLNAGPNNTRLLIWPTEQGGRLAYSVLPPSLLPIPYVPVVIVDALTGQVLTTHNLVRHQNLANVYEFNPLSTPNPIEVTLPIDAPHTVPQNELLISYNCVDTQTTKTVNYMGLPITVHVCELLQNAQADGDTGDYTQYALEDHTSGGDPFAQVSLFYHAAKAYSYFKLFDPGFELEASSKPLFLVANLMIPAGLNTLDFNKMADTSLPLEPFPNAMSVGWDPMMGDLLSAVFPEITGGVLMLGQGKKVDYAYDGDVVYHEFAHSVVGSTIGLVGWWHLDEQGASAAPGSMNEALADYFAAAITSDPSMGEYSAQETGHTEIRHLENGNACPSHLAGEVHYDSEFFSAALWAVRKSRASDAEKFALDEAIFTAISTAASGDIGFEQLAELLVAAVANSSLGQSVGDELRQAFASRGVLPSCQRMFVYDGKPISSKATNMKSSFISAGKSMFAAGSLLGYAPGTFQVEVPLPEATTSFVASFGKLSVASSMPFGQGTPFKPAFIVSFDEPLSFDWSTKTSNASDPVECASLTGSRMGATLDVPAGAQKAYVMLVNQGDQDGYVSYLLFDFESDVDGGVDAEPPIPDAALQEAAVPEPDPGQPTGPGASDDADDGCGCRTPGGRPGGFGIAALVALAGLGIARRRRNGTIPS